MTTPVATSTGMKIAWAYVITAQFKIHKMTPPMAGYQPFRPPVRAKRTMPAAVLRPPTIDKIDRLLLPSPTPVMSAMWLPIEDVDIAEVVLQPPSMSSSGMLKCGFIW